MRNLLLFFISFVTISTAFSQEVRFGFTASPTFSFTNSQGALEEDAVNTSVSYLEDKNSKVGLVYGVLLDYDFDGNERYFIHSGLMFHHSGYAFSTENAETKMKENDYKVNANYIEVPLILKLKTNEIGYFRYYGQFGLNNGILISDQIKEPKKTTKLDKEIAEVKTINSGLNFGAGVEYTISDDTSAVLGLYYVNGFSKNINSPAGIIKQNQLGIRIGVYF